MLVAGCDDAKLFTPIEHPAFTIRSPNTVRLSLLLEAVGFPTINTCLPVELLERVKKFATEWVNPGHINGDNTHNVSATISINKERHYEASTGLVTNSGLPSNGIDTYDEWEMVGRWMWNNKDYYNGLSVLPFDGGTYTQAPFETKTKDEYYKRYSILTDVNLSTITELDDNVNFGQVAACAGGACAVE